MAIHNVQFCYVFRRFVILHVTILFKAFLDVKKMVRCLNHMSYVYLNGKILAHELYPDLLYIDARLILAWKTVLGVGTLLYASDAGILHMNCDLIFTLLFLCC